MDITIDDIQKMIQDALDRREQVNQYQLSPIAAHTHNGVDSLPIDQNTVSNGPKGLGNQYYAQEYDNGTKSSNAIIDWSRSNVQYITLGANITLTFTNAQSGMRAILQVAGAFTPTFPATVRWSGGTTPTATATSGHKDVYSFVYSGKEGLYDGAASLNYSTT